MKKIEYNLNNHITTAIEYKKLASISGAYYPAPVCNNNTITGTNGFLFVAAAAQYNDPIYERAELNSDGTINNHKDPKHYTPLRIYKTDLFASGCTPESFDCYEVTPNFRARCREALKAAKDRPTPWGDRVPVKIGGRCFSSENMSPLTALFKLSDARTRTFLYVCNVGDVRDLNKKHKFCYAVTVDKADRPVAISVLMPTLSTGLEIPVEGLQPVDRPLGDVSEILNEVENYYNNL